MIRVDRSRVPEPGFLKPPRVQESRQYVREAVLAGKADDAMQRPQPRCWASTVPSWWRPANANTGSCGTHWRCCSRIEKDVHTPPDDLSVEMLTDARQPYAALRRQFAAEWMQSLPVNLREQLAAL